MSKLANLIPPQNLFSTNSRRALVRTTLAASLPQAQRYVRDFICQRYRAQDTPIGLFYNPFTILQYFYCKQIIYIISKYDIQFQFISHSLNYFVTITKIKLSSDYILKFYHITSIISLRVHNPSSNSRIIVYHLSISIIK